MGRSRRVERGRARTLGVLRGLSSWGCRSAWGLVRGRFSAPWVLALLVWSCALLAPVGAAASSVYYAGNFANHVLPFAIGADGSLSPIACPGSNCDTATGPIGEAVSPNGRFLYTGGGSGDVSAFAVGAGGSLLLTDIEDGDGGVMVDGDEIAGNDRTT